MNLTKSTLVRLYITEQRSASEIAKIVNFSENKIHYWLSRHNIAKRSISDALYIKHNPGGDPFAFIEPDSLENAFLFGLGLGLYWGEGNKKNSHSVRLGNVDPALLRAFLVFLKRSYHIDSSRLKFGLQIFTDIQPEIALKYWCKELRVSKSQFQKPVVTKSGRLGTYREKSKYGVVTLYFHNKKLRDSICSAIAELTFTSQKNAILAQLVERVHGRAKSSRPRTGKLVR